MLSSLLEFSRQTADTETDHKRTARDLKQTKIEKKKHSKETNDRQLLEIETKKRKKEKTKQNKTKNAIQKMKIRKIWKKKKNKNRGNVDTGERSFRCCSKCSSKPHLEKAVDRRRGRMLAWKRRRRRRRRILARERRQRRLRTHGWTYNSVQTAIDRILGWKLWKGGKKTSGISANAKQAKFQVSLQLDSSLNEKAGKTILLLQRDS